MQPRDEDDITMGAEHDKILRALYAVGAEEEREEIFTAIGDDFAGYTGANVAIGGFFGDIVHAVSNVTKAATSIVSKGLGGVANLAGKIPVIGTPLHAALGAAAGPFRLADALTHGARIDRAVLGNLKEQLNAARTLAPYAQTVVSMVPGVGSGVAGAIAAGSALAQGRPISEAAIAAVRGAIPGGALAQGAFDLAHKIVKGEKVTGAILAAARNQLPAEARVAFDTGLALANGKKMQDVMVKAVVNLTPEGMVPFAKIGSALTSLAPKMSALRATLSGKEKMGFDIVNGVLAHSGVPEHALLAMRGKLGKEAQRGFDTAIATQAKLVKKGVLRSVPSVIKDAPGAAQMAARLANRDGATPPPPPSPSVKPRQPGAFPVAAGDDSAAGFSFQDIVREVQRRQKQAPARGVARGVEAAFGGMFGSLLKNLHRARLAQKRGRKLTPTQTKLLAHYRAMHTRAKAGHPKATAFMLSFRRAIEEMKKARGMSAVLGDAGIARPAARSGARFPILVSAILHALRAKKRGSLTAPQVKLLARFQKIRRNARAGKPGAVKFMRAFRQEVERRRTAHGANVSGDVFVGGDQLSDGRFFVGDNGVGADQWRARVVSPGNPTGDVFIGSIY
jgi:hypothetical protein